MTNKTLFVYNNLNGSNSKEDMADVLSDIGEAIDLARKSVLVSKPFKTFIEGFVLSENVNLDADVKQELANAISEKWDDTDYHFATTFTALEEAVLIAQSLNSGMGSISLENMSGVLSNIIESESAKTTINQILETGIITDILGENEEAKAITEVVDMLVNGTNNENSLNNAISAGQEIVDIIDASKSDDGFVLAGDNQEQKEQSAKTILQNIAKSDAVMDMLDKSADDSNSAVGSLLSNAGGDMNILKSSIEGADLTQEQKDIFNKIFA